MANDPLSRLASAIGLMSHDDEHQRAAALRGATAMLARHGLGWREVGLIVSAHLHSGGKTPGPAPEAAPTPERRPEPKPQPRQRHPEYADEDETPEQRQWSEWRRARGGGEPPKPRRPTRTVTEPARYTGLNVPGEIFGRIVLRDRVDARSVIFDIDDETAIYGPLVAFPGVIARTIQRSNGMRIHAKVVAARDRHALPRVYAIDVM